MTVASPRSVETRLRTVLLGAAAACAAGTIVELVLTEHTEGVLQWTPFVLASLALGMIGWLVRRPGPTSVRALQWTMPLLVAGSVVGMAQHMSGNLAIEAEVKPQIEGMARAWNALFGANPLLAPGILALVGVLAWAATIGHPALGQSGEASSGGSGEAPASTG